MEAKLYIDGNYTATILIPGESYLTTVAQGIANQASVEHTNGRYTRYTTDDVDCAVMLTLRLPTKFDTG